MNTYNDVLAFMRIGQPEQCPDTPQPLAAPPETMAALSSSGTALVAMATALKGHNNLLALRARLMLEELGETLMAMAEGNLPDVADGIADLEYVAVGTAIALGIEHDRVWEAVQASNMDKYPMCDTCVGRGHTAREHDIRVAVMGEAHAYAAGASEVLCAMEHQDDRVAMYELWRCARDGARPYFSMGVNDLHRARTRLAAVQAQHRCTACNGIGHTVLRDAQGKVQKPPGWRAPDIAGVLSDQKLRE